MAREGKRTLKTRIPNQILERMPENHLLIYAHLWEFETWLREMVYVELMSRYGSEWSKKIEGDAERARSRDARLSHMPTRESLSTSYVMFSQLCRTIKKHWRLFESYLPLKDIWLAKIGEVEQIRNRIAHFRRGHTDDLGRLQQLLRDVDRGFWSFCTSYNVWIGGTWPARDAIIKEFAEYDPLPWVKTEDGEWDRLGISSDHLAVEVQIELNRRPWLKSAVPVSVVGKYGYLYDVTLRARSKSAFDYRQFLIQTYLWHKRVCHVCLSTEQDTVRITVSTVLGSNDLIAIIRAFIRGADAALVPRQHRDLSSLALPDTFDAETRAVEGIALQWPENVLGPSNPLTFLGPGTPSAFFGIS